jgi:hypothetical protein
MKKLAFLIGVLASGWVANVASAAPIQVSGYYSVAINGFLRLPISQGGQVTCTGYLYAVPNTAGNLVIANIPAAILANSATSNGSTTATIAANKQNFDCQITVPFYYNAFDSATQSLYLVYSVKLNDPGFINTAVNPPVFVPGTGVRSNRQTTIISSPPTGTGVFQGVGPFTIYM